jgi:hypothetical protein
VEYNKLLSCSNVHFKQGYYHSASDILDGDVWVEDDEGWSFYVTPSFGCVHFEEHTANIKEGVALQPTTAPCCEGEAPHAGGTGTSA